MAQNNAPIDSPEANATQSIRLFCDSATDSNRDEEVLHLPVIVEAAESSPGAAQAAALQIRRYLHREYATKPHVQYNAIMLVRILSDNPGPTFTRCFDQSFVKTVKELLRSCKDNSTQQILRETLDSIEVNKAYDEGVQGLIAMWRKEKGAQGSLNHHARGSRGPGGYQSRGPNMSGGRGMMGEPYNSERVFQRNQLPPAHELASRIEEAKNTAKILLQLIQQSPAEDLVSNELVREFNERCQAAQKSMQVYINCDSPPPDDDTMLTLIETNEQLSLASSRYQRAILTARRQLGRTTSGNTSPEAMNDGYGAFTSPPAAGQAESLFRPASHEQANGGSPVSPIFQHGNINGSSNDMYQSPPGPPLQQARHNHAPSTSSSLYDPPQQTQETSNPFLDPVEHNDNPPPLAMAPPPPRKPGAESYPAPAANSHATQRPGVGPYHSSGITPSYIGRQTSAADGLTMHGADSPDKMSAVEIDGHSNVGRYAGVAPGAPSGYDADDNHYTVIPIDERSERMGRRVSRVDVAGTGGLRDPR